MADSRSRAAFGYANFRRYMLARFLITCASEIQSVAVGWQIYSITHRPLDLGLVGLAQFLPGVCLFLFAGHTADRIARLTILRTCYASFSVCSLALVALTLHGLGSPHPIYGVLLLNGVVRAFNAPASQAMLPLLVGEQDFPNAVAWSSSIFQTATILGPVAGGVLYGISDNPVVVYMCAAAAYLIAFLCLQSVKIQSSEVKAFEDSRTTGLSDLLLQGLRYIRHNKLILGAVSLDLFAVLLGGAVALLPVYAREILSVGAAGLGILRAAPGIGAVLMAIAVAHWPLKRRAGAAMLTCVFAFGLFTVVFGLSRNVALSLIMLVLIGASDMVSVIVRHTMIQLATPNEMRGRVSAVNMVFISASNEVGQFESGVTAQWFGTVPAVVLGGFGTMAIVLGWMLLFPALRRVDTLEPASLSAALEQAREEKDVIAE